MPLLLRLAFVLCPTGFRREYEAQILMDAGDARWGGARKLLVVCSTVAWSGLLLRGESFWHNVVYAARSLAKSRLYATVSVLAVALAIGANIAVTGALKGVLLEPLPYSNAGELYSVAPYGGYSGWSYLNAREYVGEASTIADFGMALDDQSTLRGRGRPVLLDGKQVDETYFRVLGVTPQLGRFIDARDTGRNVAVIADATWRAQFGADPAIVGSRIDLDGTAFTVIGVAPKAFRDPELGGLAPSAYWVPLDMPARHVRPRGDGAGFVRLRPGVSEAAATADLHRVVADIDRRHPNPALFRRAPGTVTALATLVVGPVRTMLWLLYAAVGVLLVIACANVANLALVRAAAREPELLIRGALGAGNARIAAQLCTESALVCAAGGIAGFVLGAIGLRLFASFGSRMLPRWDDVHVDGTLTAYAAVLVAVATITSGLLPVLRLSRDAGAGLRATGRSAVQRAAVPLRTTLVVGEIALALAVVLSAGLILRSFVTLTHVKLGFEASHVVQASRIALPALSARSFERRLSALKRLRAAAAHVPGVLDVAVSANGPFRPPFGVSANVPANAPAEYSVRMNAVSNNYFALLHVPLLAGRAFGERDALHAPAVAIVNAAFARRFFPGASPLGRTVLPHMDIGPGSVVPRTIVGIVGDMRHALSAPTEPEVFVPVEQFAMPRVLLLQTDAPENTVTRAVAGVIGQLDPTVAAPVVRPLQEIVAESALQSQAVALLFGCFALVALALALAGIYAVTAYSVEQRTAEFGLRKAVGAKDAHVLRGVVGDIVRYGAAGIAAGVCLTAASARLLSDLLFQTSPFDPLTFGAVIAGVLGCTVLAALVPALRATRVQPATALRYQ